VYRHKVVWSALIGLVLGVLAGTAEVLRLTWFVRGVGFRPELLVYAWVIDGGALAAIGLLAGVVWTLWGWRRQRRRASAPPARTGPTGRIVPARGASRRAVLRLATAGVASLGVLSIAGLARQSESLAATVRQARDVALSGPDGGGSPPPNILLVTVDTLRADQLGSYGHPFVKTPALDAVAAQGARFVTHTIQEPQTNPSHASMFTGMYPSSSGVRIHMVDKLPDSLDTLATVFSQAGYATAGLYSWMSFDSQYSNFQRGFQVYQDLTLNKPGLLSNPIVQQGAASYRVAEQYLLVPQVANSVTGLNQQVESNSKGRADRTTDAAIAQLKSFGSQPFFMWLHYFDPHYPYEPPGQYATLYDAGYTGKLKGDIDTVEAIINGQVHPAPADLQRLLSLYQGEISYMDSQISRLFSALDSLGLTQSTVVAVTGDHGESFAEHTDFEEDGNIFHPRSLYDVEQRVPLLLRYPARIQPGTVVTAPTQSIDLFPTFLELAGLPASHQAQGKSVVGLLDGSDSGSARLAFASMPDYVFTSVTAPGWKLIQNNASGQRRLYDLNGDPQETKDVWQANGEVGARLAAQLQSWMKAVKIS